MDQIFHEIKINTEGQGLYDFTDKPTSWINKQKINNGILNINILHTSASLVIQENADPDVLYDLKNFFDKLAPMDNKLYKHTTEGKDDMPAHIKSAITNIITNDLKHMHGDIDKLHAKIDRLLWWIIGGLGATMLTIVSVLT